MDLERNEDWFNGYNTGIQEGRSKERDIWMPKYDNLLKQWQNSFLERDQRERLFEQLHEDFIKLLRNGR